MCTVLTRPSLCHCVKAGFSSGRFSSTANSFAISLQVSIGVGEKRRVEKRETCHLTVAARLGSRGAHATAPGGRSGNRRGLGAPLNQDLSTLVNLIRRPAPEGSLGRHA